MITVTCAVIRNEDNNILVVQRGEATDHPFKWEFPGGKLHTGETPEECVIREVKEELSVDIVIFGRMPSVEHDYGIKKINLIPFICDTLDDLPFLSEHIAYKWVEPAALGSIDFSEADVFVAENYLLTLKRPAASEILNNVSSQSSTDDEQLRNMVNRIMGMKEAEFVAASAIENPAVFKKLLEYSFSDDSKLAFHASWTITKVCDKFPEVIYPFLTSIIDSLKSIENESALRSFLRIISLTDLGKINQKQHGLLADFCFNALNSGLSAIAIKAYAMEILYRLSQLYPELAVELSASIINLLGDASAGISSRGRMILKRIANLPGKPAGF